MNKTTRWAAVAAALGMGACEPPPLPAGAGGEPAIELIYPPADVGEIPLTEDGGALFLDLLVVAAVDNFTYVSPTENKDDVEGEGHFHFNVNGVYRDAPPARFYSFRSDADEFSVGQRVQVSVTLASNTHQDLDTFTDWIDLIEFDVVAPVDDGGGDTDDTDGT